MRTFVLICLVVVAFQSFAQNEASGMNGLVLSPDGKPMEGTLPVRNSKLRLSPVFLGNHAVQSRIATSKFLEEHR